MRKCERGNILFLILLAVVLFAALSYAVTSSLRGGGNDASPEKVKAYVAELLQVTTGWKAAIDRLYLVGNYDQVLFNESAPTDSGTCYRGNASVTPCKTIGLFHESTGVTPHFLPTGAYEPGYADLATTTSVVMWQSRNAQVDGVDIGTVAADEFIIFMRLSEEVCAEINRQFHGDPTPIAESIATGGAGMRSSFYRKDLTFGGSTNTNGISYSADSGCALSGSGTIRYYLIIVRRV